MLGVPALAQPVGYTAAKIDLGGATIGGPMGMNNHGQVLFFVAKPTDAVPQGYIWDRGALTPGVQDTYYSYFLMDDGRQGFKTVDDNDQWHLKIGTSQAASVELASPYPAYTFGGSTHLTCASPNGQHFGAVFNDEAVYWSGANQQPTVVGKFGGFRTGVDAVNSSGVVAGTATDFSRPRSPFETRHAWRLEGGDHGPMVEIPCPEPGYIGMEVRGVLEDGTILGNALWQVDDSQAEPFHRGWQWKDGVFEWYAGLDVYGYGIDSNIIGHNYTGLTIGTVGAYRGVVFDSPDHFWEIPPLVRDASFAEFYPRYINDAGQILGDGGEGANFSYYLLTPIVPEPTVALTLLAALTRLTSSRRR
jgi:hypothetical protein